MKLLAALVALLLLPAAAAAEVPPNADWTEDWIQDDSQPTLHVDILKPKGTPADAKLPAIVSVGPYFAHSGSTPDSATPTNDGPQLRWRDLIEEGKLFERGYALIQVDLRGFGASAGCNDFGGPGEQYDVKRAVEWTVSQPWSTGKVALYGKSYDAWTAVMGLDEKPQGLAAAIIQAPIIDGYRTLYQNGVHYGPGWWATPGLYQAIDAMPPTPFDSPEYFVGAATGTDPACYGTNVAMQNATWERDTDFWRDRDLPGARGSDVPVLWSHGFHDANTKPDNFMDVWSTLQGPKRAWFGQFAHDRGNEAAKVGHKGFFEDVFALLDRYVKGDGAADPHAEPSVEVAEGDGRWRYEAQWPPADLVIRRMAVNAGTFRDSAYNSGAIWSVTPPFPHEGRVSGVPRLTVDASTVSPRGNLIAHLFDVDPQGVATLMVRGAHVVKGAAGKLEFELYPHDWTVKAGHRLALRITGSDPNWYVPPHSGADVAVAGGYLDIPFLSYVRDAFIGAEETPAIRNRSRTTLSEETLGGSTVAFEMPRALVPRPANTSQGAVRPPHGAEKPAARLKVIARRKHGRIVVRVARAGRSRVRVALLRRSKTVARRTVTARRGVARTDFRVARKGVYRVTARTLGGVRLSGRSRKVRVR